ncbi:GntR family transcriptional regulator [Bacillus sp. FJAT-49711]|uniref:GntR family transcriptional regulator n=1 Tax=Bacillus sp. FJAT-49711 TaxID=2833585 RepID=UPI0032D5A3FB
MKVINKETHRGSTRDYSYKKLKMKILNLELEPGTKISEKEIADEFHVSRTPVREAFMKLAQEELLDIIPQSGTIVSRINLDYVEEGRFIREKIEKEMVVLACKNFPEDDLFRLETNLALQELCIGKNNFYQLYELDEEFHRILFNGVGKARTWKMLQLLNSHFNRLRLLRLSKVSNWDSIISQHKSIYQFIVDKNAEEASQMMERHLQMAVVEKEIMMKKYPHYFI